MEPLSFRTDERIQSPTFDTMTEKKDIRELSNERLRNFLEEAGERPFRAKQIEEWLWQKGASTFSEMSNLSLKLRAHLEEHFQLKKIRKADVQTSEDGTIKNAFELPDGKVIEGVLIPQKDRMTACVSSQVGCALACDFCATAALKKERNLKAHEIFDQVETLDRQARDTYGTGLTNIVYMGMGEPLLNHREVRASIDRITDERGMGLSPKRITVSTVGIAKMIEKLAEAEVRFELALSLHAARDEKRSRIMEINKSNDLDSLKTALKKFHERTGKRITLEFIVFKEFNDEPEDAEDLIAFCQEVPSKVNIIEYNPIDGGSLAQASRKKFERFVDLLDASGVIVNVRRSRGKDIDAACGQLANKNGLKKVEA
ncbi:MAG: 23S rRNA (adenine(2503)-C(2))-methyltransferase RlmN [Flavobacteriales bacterium]